MSMVPIFNNVGRMLGHIDAKTYIDRHDTIVVYEDTLVSPYDPGAKVSREDATVNICYVAKKRIRFWCGTAQKEHVYLITEHKLPDWFWKNPGCVEFKPEHFERMPW